MSFHREDIDREPTTMLESSDAKHQSGALGQKLPVCDLASIGVEARVRDNTACNTVSYWLLARSLEFRRSTQFSFFTPPYPVGSLFIVGLCTFDP